MERQNRLLKEGQELYQTMILPFKPLTEVAQEQLQRALTESDKLKQLLPSMQEAVIQTTCEVSAVQTSLRKMNDVLVQITKQKKTLQMMPPALSSRDSIISEGSAYAGEGEVDVGDVYRQQPHNDYATSGSGATTSDLQLTQEDHHIKGRPLERSQVEKRRRSESTYSAGKTKLPLRHVQSDDSRHHAQVNIGDPQLKFLLEQRREHIEATSNTQ